MMPWTTYKMLKIATMLTPLTLPAPYEAVQVEAAPRKARVTTRVRPRASRKRRGNVPTAQNGIAPKKETSLIV